MPGETNKGTYKIMPRETNKGTYRIMPKETNKGIYRVDSSHISQWLGYGLQYSIRYATGSGYAG